MVLRVFTPHLTTVQTNFLGDTTHLFNFPTLPSAHTVEYLWTFPVEVSGLLD